MTAQPHHTHVESGQVANADIPGLAVRFGNLKLFEQDVADLLRSGCLGNLNVRATAPQKPHHREDDERGLEMTDLHTLPLKGSKGGGC